MECTYFCIGPFSHDEIKNHTHLLIACYDFVIVFITKKSCSASASLFSKLVYFIARILKKVDDLHISQRSIDILERLIDYCDPDHTESFIDSYRHIGTYACKYYNCAYLGVIDEEKLYISILNLFTKLVKWKPFQEALMREGRLFVYPILLSITPFFGSNELLKKTSFQMLLMFLGFFRSKFVIIYSSALVWTIAYYLHPSTLELFNNEKIECNEVEESLFGRLVRDGRYEELYNSALCVEDLNTQKIFDFMNIYSRIPTDGSSQADANVRSMYTNAYEMVSRVVSTILSNLMEDHEEISSLILKDITVKCRSANHLYISNLCSEIVSFCTFKKLNSVAMNKKDIETLQAECKDAKSKLDRLTCIICFEYLFDNDPVCLDCGHLFCLVCHYVISLIEN